MGIDSRVAFDTSANVLVLQKHRDPRMILEAAKAEFLVYDFDDTEVEEVLPLIARKAHLITTDTEGHAAWGRKKTDRKIFVVPDPIDYGIPGPMPPTEGSGVCWFGHPTNFPSVSSWARVIRDAGLSFTTISSQQMDSFPNLPWSLDTFVATLRQFAVCLLSHEGADPGKSPNKLTTAITAGVPCVVSDTPEYARVIREACGGFGIAADPDEAVKVTADLLSPETRESYLRLAQPWVWSQYNLRRVAETWLQAVRERL